MNLCLVKTLLSSKIKTNEKGRFFKMKKVIAILGSIFLATSLFASVASAHVTVQPKETTQGSYEVFTVRVPSENEKVPTTKMEVKVPAEVNISRLEPKPGWTYELKKDATDKITSIIWTTEGEGLSSTEFGQFLMQGKVDDQAKELVWKAYQTYQDGSLVEWVGAADADKPASVTKVNPAAAGSTDSHGAAHTEKTVENEQQVQSVSEETSSGSNAPLYVAIAALIVAILAFAMSFRKRG